MRREGIIKSLKDICSEKDRAGMARFGINTKTAFGVLVHKVSPVAEEIWPNHGLALELWKSGLHEAMILALSLDSPSFVTGRQMKSWAKGFGLLETAAGESSPAAGRWLQSCRNKARDLFPPYCTNSA